MVHGALDNPNLISILQQNIIMYTFCNVFLNSPWNAQNIHCEKYGEYLINELQGRTTLMFIILSILPNFNLLYDCC